VWSMFLTVAALAAQPPFGGASSQSAKVGSYETFGECEAQASAVRRVLRAANPTRWVLVTCEDGSFPEWAKPGR